MRRTLPQSRGGRRGIHRRLLDSGSVCDRHRNSEKQIPASSRQSSPRPRQNGGTRLPPQRANGGVPGPPGLQMTPCSRLRQPRHSTEKGCTVALYRTRSFRLGDGTCHLMLFSLPYARSTGQWVERYSQRCMLFHSDPRETLVSGAASYIFSWLWCAVEHLDSDSRFAQALRSSRVITDSMQLSDTPGIVPLTA